MTEKHTLDTTPLPSNLIHFFCHNSNMNNAWLQDVVANKNDEYECSSTSFLTNKFMSIWMVSIRFTIFVWFAKQNFKTNEILSYAQSIICNYIINILNMPWPIKLVQLWNRFTRGFISVANALVPAKYSF